jgi:hypothetical protein
MEDYILFVAETLTAVVDGSIKHLIVNEPPRHLKSLLTSVFFRRGCLEKTRLSALSSSAIKSTWPRSSPG